MIIDFHTHVYPDKLAGRLMHDLADANYWGHFSDGTLNGLLHSMKMAGIDCCVTQPVVTRPDQFDSINHFAKKQQEVPGLIPFGGIHPDCDDIPGKLRFLKQQGFPGIKLHPDWQDLYLDEPRAVYLIREALELDMIVMIHAGFDGAFKDSDRCTPKRSLRLLEQLPDSGQDTRKLILAHSGGHLEHEDVKKYLLGANVYFDISLSQMYLSDAEFMKLVRGHGADKLLFATDSPYASQLSSVEAIKKRPLSPEEYALITEGNARRLLHLNSARLLRKVSAFPNR
ncbi:MAG: TatD family hydrolase [Lachnospiraceae bacterium]|nr:TatD family hydrolase [Lachnospiraceae bacterium]MDY4969665.1 amidohydrolase family protein [Lachnospiraceae bacterium]